MIATQRKSIAFAHRPGRGITDEWLTPPWLVDRLLPDTFDLDPCAPAVRHWDTAQRHLTKADDGLSQPWQGRVWLNPPYSDIGRAMELMASHNSGIALVFARTETAWFFETVWNRATSILFLRGRLHFHNSKGIRASGNAGGPHVLVGYGGWTCDRLHGLRDLGIYMRLRGAV